MYKTTSAESVPQQEPTESIVHGHLFQSCLVSLFGCSAITEVQTASLWDKFLIIVGLLSAIIAGLCLPLIVVLFAQMMDVFLQYELYDMRQKSETSQNVNRLIGYRWVNSPNKSDEELTLVGLIADSRRFSLLIAVIAVVQLATGFIFVKTLNYTAQKYTLRIRVAYVKALLSNEIAWFDLQNKSELCASTNSLINAVHDGRAEKLGLLVYTTSTTVSCFVVSLVYGWKLALVVFTVLPVVVAIAYFGKKTSISLEDHTKECYREAETLVTESLLNVRNVALYQGEKHESALFRKSLCKSVIGDIYVSSSEGLFQCLLWLTLYCSYALAFYVGVLFAVEQDHVAYQPDTLIVVFFCAQIGVVNFLQLPALLAVPVRARQAANKVESIIHRKAVEEHIPLDKTPLSNFTGYLRFEEVSFAYPASPEVNVVQSLSFEIFEDQTVVFVGASGSGKSTIMRLIHRLYEPHTGNIRIDGVNVRKLNVSLLRKRVGFVQQHPILFGATIGEAMRCNTPNLPLIDVMEAAKITGVHDTIMAMTRKYDTPMTANLSDDLKQRIAITRVLLRRPHVLILDNACSCMTAVSEDRLHRAIMEHGTQKTLLIVSSRVQAMSTADQVFHIVDGKVAESGPFVKLMENKGRLYKIVKRSLLLKRGHGNRMEEDSIDEFESLPSQRLSQLRDLSTFNRPQKGCDSDGDLARPAAVHVSRFPVFPNIVDVDNLDNFTYAIDEMKEFSWRSFLLLNAPEWPYLLTACLAATVTGLALPAYAVLFGDCLWVIAMKSSDADFKEKLSFYTQLFVMAGFICGIARLVQGYMVGVAGAKLTRRLRVKVFDAMLRQELAWFDEETNNIEQLLRLIREDAANAKSACGPRLANLSQQICTLLVCVGLALHYSWQLGITVLLCVPVLLYALVRHANLTMEHVFSEGVELQKAKAIVEEAVMNITTVHGLVMESTFVRQYSVEVARVHRKLSRLIRARGLTFGLALATPCFSYAVFIWFAGNLLRNEDITFDKMFKVTEVLILGTLMLTQIVNFSPDIVNARISAARLFRVINRTPLIYSPTTEFQEKWKTSGNIKFRRLGFVHRTRTGLPTLSMFNVMLEPGKILALVGPLGSGKSVPIQLMCRFYNPTAGVILMDGRDIASMNLCTVRAQLGLADGDPLFFRRTVAENIAYGSNHQAITMDDVVCAAKEANIHNWITSLDEGYHTVVDESALRMTPSQKLRLSLARALIRDPPILLIENLQESETEEASMLVDDAIRRACMGRAVMIVLRHLKLVVRRADSIVVMRNGEMVEEGTHETLIEKRGVYYRLYCRQELLHRRTESTLIHQTIVRDATKRAERAVKPLAPVQPPVSRQPSNAVRRESSTFVEPEDEIQAVDEEIDREDP